jgi:hypothetical protein
MISIRRLTVASSALLLSLMLAHGQTIPTVQQKSERSTCTNIVALTGNVKVNCSNLTPDQKKMLERIPALLKKILANQGDSNALMDKMDEILRATSRPIETVNAPNGIGTIGGTLINPEVNNYGYIEKKLSEAQMSKISDLMRPFADSTDRSDLIYCEGSYFGSITIANQLVKAFRDAGWILKGTGFGEGFGGVPPEPLLILISSAGHYQTDGMHLTSNEGLPAGAFELANALREAGISVGFALDPGVPAAQFRIRVGAHP